jgi:ABC-type multidrug transport system ATPase subunit
VRGKVGIVYQEDVLWPDLSVDDNLYHLGVLKNMNEDSLYERIDFLKTLLALGSFSHKKAKHLSGGNKRKLC